MQRREIHLKENCIEKFPPAVSSTEMKLHSLATMVMTCLVNGNYAVLARAGIPVCLNVKVSVHLLVKRAASSSVDKKGT